MRILVTGDRKWSGLSVMAEVLSEYPKGTTLIHGYASGADTMADVIGQELGFEIIRCPAHWSHNCKLWVEVYGECPPDCKEMFGRPAGVIRNQFMLEKHNPELILAFHNDIDNSRGTKDMVRRAQKRGIPFKLYDESGLRKIWMPMPKRSDGIKSEATD